jgi:hypothetical protein
MFANDRPERTRPACCLSRRSRRHGARGGGHGLHETGPHTPSPSNKHQRTTDRNLSEVSEDLAYGDGILIELSLSRWMGHSIRQFVSGHRGARGTPRSVHTSRWLTEGKLL